MGDRGKGPPRAAKARKTKVLGKGPGGHEQAAEGAAAVVGRGRRGTQIEGTPAEVRGLSEYEEAFCQHYCANGGVASRALRAAGFRGSRIDLAAREMMSKPAVQARIREIQADVCARLGITHQRLVEEAARVAFARMEHVVTWGPRGVEINPLEDAPDAERAAIAEIVQTVTESGGTLRVKMHDKLRALEILAKLTGANAPERVDVTGLDVLRTLDDATLRARVAELERAISGS